MAFKATKGQAECVDKLVKWWLSGWDQDFIYAGPAGTGKTTLVREFIRRLNISLDDILFVAYTGKAASRLAMGGFKAETIHSAFMENKLVPLYKNNELIYKNGRLVKVPSFVPKKFIPGNIKLIVLDEWSFVNTEMRDLIYKFNVPVIAMGDEDQLPPIFGESPFKYDIDYRLWEITRQAEDNGIIQLATLIREGKDLPSWYCNFNSDAYVIPKSMLMDKHLQYTDIVLVGKNKTRNYFNHRIRKLNGSTGKLPILGDKLICRKNYKNRLLNDIPLTNGTLGTMVNPIRRSECDLKNGIYRMDFKPDYITDNNYNYYESLPCDYGFLNEPCSSDKIADKYNTGVKIEYGEAITTHLSQGSEFENVLYWDDWMRDRDYMRKIRYTAVTRATNKVFMFI